MPNQDIQEELFNRFRGEHSMGLSRNTTKNFIIIARYLTIHSKSQQISINLADTIDDDNEFWGRLHQYGKSYDSQNYYHLVHDIAKYFYKLEKIPNDLGQLDHIWETFLWQLTYVYYLKNEIYQLGAIAANFNPNSFNPTITITKKGPTKHD